MGSVKCGVAGSVKWRCPTPSLQIRWCKRQLRLRCARSSAGSAVDGTSDPGSRVDWSRWGNYYPVAVENSKCQAATLMQTSITHRALPDRTQRSGFLRARVC